MQAELDQAQNQELPEGDDDGFWSIREKPSLSSKFIYVSVIKQLLITPWIK
jgi:hypothetical protein